MPDQKLTAAVKQAALAAGADLVGIAPIERFDGAPPEVDPRGIFSRTRSAIALGVRMLRGALKTIEEGQYWQAYNCDSYQYLNEVLAPHMLRKVVLMLEDHGWTAVPIHNPFGAGLGKPVKPGGVRPDGNMSLRVIGCAAGLGELGHSKLFLTPRFGPRQRMFAVLTDAELVGDPMLEGHICDDCGACVRSCPGAIPAARTIKFTLGGREFSHADVNFKRCTEVHQGWDPKYTPFLKPGSSRENPPPYYQFLDRRFRHHSICGARGCVRACMDHLEKAGRISARYHTPMIEGEQWTLED